MIPYREFLIRHRKRILIWTGAALTVFTLVGFFVAPPLLKSIVAKQLSSALHRDVTIREVRLNPFALSATVRGLAIKEPHGPETFVSFEELYVNLEVSSLFRWAVVVREFRLTQPFIRIVHRQDQTYSFSDLLPKEQGPPQGAPTKPLHFSVNNIRIVGGGADILDEPTQKKHTLRELNIGIPFLSSIPSQVEIFVQPGLSAQINGTRYTIQGKTKPFADSLDTTLEINIADLDLPYYLAYVPSDLLNFALPSGRLDAKLSIAFVQHQKMGQTLAVKGDVGLRELAVDDKQGSPVIRIPTLGIELASVEPLARKAHLSKVSLQSPELTVRREKRGMTNLETLLPKQIPEKQPTERARPPQGEAFAFDVDEIGIAGAKILFSDLSLSSPFKTSLESIDLKVTQLSNRPNTGGTYSLTLKTEAKEAVALEGKMSLAPLTVEGSVNVKSLLLKKYAPYCGDRVLFDIVGGTIDLSSRYRYAQGEKEPEIGASEAAVRLSGLRLRRREESEDFLRIPVLAIKNTGLDLSKQDVLVGDLSTEGGTILVSRSREGEINLTKLLPRATAAPSGVENPGAAPAAGRPAQSARPWTVKAAAISVKKYRIQVTDQVPSEPVNLAIEDLNLKAENLSTADNQPPGKVSLALRLDKGTVVLDGTARIAPVLANLQLAVKEIDIRLFQPYFTDKVQVTLTDGRFSTSGRLDLSIKEPAGLQAKYTGETTLGNFAAIEKASAEDILKWDSLALHELSVGYNPLVVRAKKVALADFFARVIIQPNGRLNLKEMVGAPEPEKPTDQPQTTEPAPQTGQTAEAEAPAPAATSPGQDIRIEEVTLQGGHVQFLDRSLKPNYSSSMTEIGGRVSGLSSMETSLADVELRGKMNNSAPLEITGKINPLTKNLYADLRVRFTGMDLSPTSPYSGKYVGYSIEKGKLSFDLKYLIDKRRLSSENKIFLDQFTFGDKIDSPTATSLPVKLGVALLKDRNGEIHLDIPVTGSLDDPKFSMWGVIWQVIGNLITKAVTSPFALLGAAFGGGEELQYVEFDYGRAAIPADGAKKIVTLATGLAEKPSLKLEIAGYVAPEADREGLKQFLLQRKVKAQKLTELTKKGAPAVSVDDVPVAPEEYEKYLTLAYRAEKFPKPRNFIGLVKGLPVAEMEKLMLTHIEAGEEQLRQLASQRASAVKEAILRSGKVEAERLFIVEPKGLTPEKKDNVKESRVEFKIA